MDPKTAQILLGSAGAAGGPATYVDDVFSIHLYQGTGANQTITNGIDLSGEGGLVWIKSRDGSLDHNLFDTERGAGRYLASNQTSGETLNTTRLSSFNSNGFSLGDDPITNSSGSNGDLCSWTFRKAPGFFDVVTYTGTGSARTIAHSLGSTPGMIMIKGTSQAYDWKVWHRSLGSGKYIVLNSTAAEVTGDTAHWNNTDPTSTHFSLGTGVGVNADGESFVAYIFAHDDQSFGTGSDEAIIECGTYTGNGSSSGPTIDLGFEPQWILGKSTASGPDWFMLDNMRRWDGDGGVELLRANLNGAETELSGSSKLFSVNAEGFQVVSTSTDFNRNNEVYIYIAIRRPHKPPETATDVFDVNTESNDNNYSTTGFPVDAAISNNRDGSSHTSLLGAKLMGENVLRTGLTSSQQAYLTYGTAYAFMDKFRYAFWGSNTDGFVNYAFKRAPGFFDVATWTGDGVTGRTVNHNLTVAPEFMIVKRRSASENFQVYHKQPGETKSAFLGSGTFGSSSVWNSTAPTATQIALLGDNAVNGSGETYVGFFWATLAGISKVGHYTGTGSAINVDCGFTAGARFVLIKRTDATADWAVFDSERGIVSGNDPYWSPNNDAAENSNLDAIDPLNSGFTITSTASTMLNASGGTYIFLAIA